MSSTNHKHRYKNVGHDVSELRRRREEEGIQLRKQKRDQQLIKRRNVDIIDISGVLMDKDDEDLLAPVPDEDLGQAALLNGQLVNSEIIAQLYSSDEKTQLMALQKFRKLLSRDPNPPIDEVIRSGIVPTFVQFLGNSANPTLQVSRCNGVMGGFWFGVIWEDLISIRSSLD